MASLTRIAGGARETLVVGGTSYLTVLDKPFIVADADARVLAGDARFKAGDTATAAMQEEELAVRRLATDSPEESAENQVVPGADA